MSRNFYAIVYPDGVNPKAPTYPVEVSVHLCSLDLARKDEHEKAKLRQIFGSNWRKLTHSSTEARTARELARHGATWPITMTLTGPKEIRLEQIST